MRHILFLLLPVFVVLFLAPASADVNHDEDWGVRQCLECHPRLKPTHKSMAPGEMKENLPLDERGRMQCITCHECIAGTCTIPKDRTELCSVCHDCTQGMACILDASHIGDSKDIRYLATERCLECHGRTLNVEVCELGSETLDVLFFQVDDKSLRPMPEDLVVLVEGKVTCISCHDPYSTQRAKLIMSNRESRMCLACHNTLKKVDHSGYDRIRVCINCHPRVWPTHRRATLDSPEGDLPLDSQGGMLCMTCHDCISGTCLLRQKKPDLCASCHDCTQGMACVLNTAHMGVEGEEEGITRNGCLQCHDDVQVRLCEFSGTPDDLYGKVKCTTCHNPYSSRHAKLRKDVNKIDITQKARCPRYLSRDVANCVECHTERK